MEYICENLREVRQNILNAAIKSDRNVEDITLIAVTKNFDIDCVNAAIDCEICDAGENRVQEMLSKIGEVKKKINWHMIGHLQTNKVKYIVDQVSLIHSVDSVKLLKTIDEEANKINCICDILVQVNISGEETKFGIDPKYTYKMIEEAQNLTNVRVRGLMTIAPYVEDASENRKYFSEIKQLFEDIKKNQSGNICMEFLSMGMSGDYEVAIEEGANMVRVGSAIFGKRDYSKK